RSRDQAQLHALELALRRALRADDAVQRPAGACGEREPLPLALRVDVAAAHPLLETGADDLRPEHGLLPGVARQRERDLRVAALVQRDRAQRRSAPRRAGEGPGLRAIERDLQPRHRRLAARELLAYRDAHQVRRLRARNSLREAGQREGRVEDEE